MSGGSRLAGKLMASDGSKLDVELMSGGGGLGGKFVIVNSGSGRLAGKFIVSVVLATNSVITGDGDRLIAEVIITGGGGNWLD